MKLDMRYGLPWFLIFISLLSAGVKAEDDISQSVSLNVASLDHSVDQAYTELDLPAFHADEDEESMISEDIFLMDAVTVTATSTAKVSSTLTSTIKSTVPTSSSSIPSKSTLIVVVSVTSSAPAGSSSRSTSSTSAPASSSSRSTSVSSTSSTSRISSSTSASGSGSTSRASYTSGSVSSSSSRSASGSSVASSSSSSSKSAPSSVSSSSVTSSTTPTLTPTPTPDPQPDPVFYPTEIDTELLIFCLNNVARLNSDPVLLQYLIDIGVDVPETDIITYTATSTTSLFFTEYTAATVSTDSIEVVRTTSTVYVDFTNYNGTGTGGNPSNTNTGIIGSSCATLPPETITEVSTLTSTSTASVVYVSTVKVVNFVTVTPDPAIGTMTGTSPVECGIILANNAVLGCLVTIYQVEPPPFPTVCRELSTVLGDLEPLVENCYGSGYTVTETEDNYSNCPTLPAVESAFTYTVTASACTVTIPPTTVTEPASTITTPPIIVTELASTVTATEVIVVADPLGHDTCGLILGANGEGTLEGDVASSCLSSLYSRVSYLPYTTTLVPYTETVLATTTQTDTTTATQTSLGYLTYHCIHQLPCDTDSH